MTLSDFYRMGTKSAQDAHVTGDDLPCAAELVESLTLCGALEDLDAMPTADELAAYVQGWLDTAEDMNAAAECVTDDDRSFGPRR